MTQLASAVLWMWFKLFKCLCIHPEFIRRPQHLARVVDLARIKLNVRCWPDKNFPNEKPGSFASKARDLWDFFWRINKLKFKRKFEAFELRKSWWKAKNLDWNFVNIAGKFQEILLLLIKSCSRTLSTSISGDFFWDSRNRGCIQKSTRFLESLSAAFETFQLKLSLEKSLRSYGLLIRRTTYNYELQSKKPCNKLTKNM